MKNFKSTGLVFLVALALIVTGLAGFSQQKKGGTLQLVSSDDAKRLDPITYKLIESMRRMDLIFDSLLYRNPKGQVIPLLAKEMPDRPDKKTLVFQLHEGVLFHDGTELTSEDVKYTFKRIGDPDENSGHYNIVNKYIKSIETPDKYTVKFNLKKPIAVNLVSPFFNGIVSKEARKKMGAEKYAENPVGSGPFELVEWKKDNYMLLKRFEDYWMKEPNLAKVRFNIVPEDSTQVIRLLKGELDIVGVPSQYLKKAKQNENVEVRKNYQGHYCGMVFNTKKPPLDNKKVRKAIHYLVDRKAIMKSARGELGRLNLSITPQIVNEAWNFPEEKWKKYLPKQNVEKAKELLDEAGYTGDPRFTITLTGLNLAYYPPITTVMQNQLAKANIKAKVRNYDLGTWLDKFDTTGTIKNPKPLEKQYDMIVNGFGSGMDPDGWLYYQFYSNLNGEPNDAQFSDPQVDKWLEQARATSDKEKRRELYIKAQTKILKAYAHIPLFNNVSATGIRKRVHDYKLIPGGYGSSTPLVTPFNNVWVKQ